MLPKVSEFLWSNSFIICLSYFILVNVLYSLLFILKINGLVSAVIGQLLCFPSGIFFSSIWKIFFDLKGMTYLISRVLFSSTVNAIILWLLIYVFYLLLRRS